MSISIEESKIRKIIRSTKYRCKLHKREFNLTLMSVIKLLDKQKCKCALTGWRLEFTAGGDLHGTKNPRGVSIDRIDNSKGYTIDNIQLVCIMVNIIRSDTDINEFKEMCQAIAETSKEKALI